MTTVTTDAITGLIFITMAVILTIVVNIVANKLDQLVKLAKVKNEEE